ncbi:Wzt carbohydrate-binding domain-containing protein [Paraburkholderia dilworthii]|uniref:Wzt carbohydrate-binding domain-containing protein n=1 Tax=Paraburkholderia dilworthii TaxID=948106 RepID=A0ABW9D9Z0_9BURK
MRHIDGVFPGRVIFDHLPKTAGQAINAWLTQVLGPGCVTENLNGDHRDLIRRYGGLYSIISGHIHFLGAERLDPRYQYFTCLREPLDRAVSWMFYVLNDAGAARDTIYLKEGARQFLATDGHETSREFLESITNPYTEHFCRILGNGTESDEVKVVNALAAIRQYDVIGVYEEMPDFLADVAALINIPAPMEIERVNVTSERKAITGITSALRDRILALNRLDFRLYAEVNSSRPSGTKNRSEIVSLPRALGWQRYKRVVDRVFSTPDISVGGARIREGHVIQHGQLMTFDVDFLLSRMIFDLEMGIHLFDSDKNRVFCTDSTSLGQKYGSLSSGPYRVSHHVIADLPAGKYTAGFSFFEYSNEGRKDLAWHEVMCEFDVYHHVRRNFTGYAYLPAEICIRPLSLTAGFKIEGPEVLRFSGGDSRLHTQVGLRNENNEIVCKGQIGYLTFGPYIALTPGTYRVAVRGALGGGGLAGARLDVAIDKGARIVAECVLGEPDRNGCFANLPISLNEQCSDLEVRVWVSSGTDLRLSMIEIERSRLDVAASVSGCDARLSLQADMPTEHGVRTKVCLG